MARFILELRTPEKIEVPDERSGRDAHVIATLQKYITEERIEYLGWHYDREGDIDNGHTEVETLGQDETYFELRGDFEDIEFGDPTGALPKVEKALGQYSAHVSNYHEYQDTSEIFTKTVIEITLT